MSRAIHKATQSQGLEYNKQKHLDTTLFDGQILSRSEREQLVDYLFNPEGGEDATQRTQITALALSIFCRSAPLFIVLDACTQTEEC